jgi:hypothetical protein
MKELFGDLTPWGKFWLYVGLTTLVFAAGMSFEYGYSISILHAGFLGCLSIVTAFAPHAAHSQWERGKKFAAMGIIACTVPLFLIEFYSHAGYTAGIRGHSLAEASVQNVKYDGAQEAAKEDKSNLELWKSQLKTLLEANAWAATVKADAMRGQLELANKEIADETARGGCKAKCNKRMKERDDLAEKIGKIEQADDLSKRIEATQRILDKKREVASTVEHKSSTVDHQNKFLAKMVALVGSGKLKASDFQDEAAQQSVNMAMALAGTGLPALALFVAGLYRRPDEHDANANAIQYPLSGNHKGIDMSVPPYYTAKNLRTRQASQGRDVVIVQPPVDNRDHDARAALENLRRTLGVAFNPTTAR